jgi:hypothetical protein
MKSLLIITAILISGLVSGQQRVHVERTALSASSCQITLYPSEFETSVLSNVVFTLKWRSNRNISVGNPPASSLISVTKSGPVRTHGGWNYQIFSGCGFVTGLIGQPIVLNIPRSGYGEISLAVNQQVEHPSFNGKYYVSVGGKDVTGDILTSAKISTATTVDDREFDGLIVLYFDPLNNRYYIRRDDVYYDLSGKRTRIVNESELLIVRKRELE